MNKNQVGGNRGPKFDDLCQECTTQGGDEYKDWQLINKIVKDRQKRMDKAVVLWDPPEKVAKDLELYMDKSKVKEH